MITYNFVTTPTNNRVVLRSRQFDGVEPPQYSQIMTFDAAEAKRLLEELTIAQKKVEYSDRIRKQNLLEEKRNQMVALQEEVLKLQKEIDLAGAELKSSS